MAATPTSHATQSAGGKVTPAPKPLQLSLERLYRGVAAGLRVFADPDRRTLRGE